MQEHNAKKHYDIRANSIVDEWLADVGRGRIRAFFGGKQVELGGCEAIAGYLEDIVASVYPYGPEKLSKVATLYTSAWGKAGAEIGLQVARNVQRPYKVVVDELKDLGLWEAETLEHQRNHPVARMQKLVDDFFDAQEQVVLKDLWEALQEPPYGLLPSPIGILLFSFLLRNYAQGYYYFDGVNSLPLNPNKLAELIEQVLKGTRSSESYTIRKKSPEAERFCEVVGEVFHLSAEQARYPEEACKHMRNRLLDLGYPTWTLVYYIQPADRNKVQKMARAADILSYLVSYNRDELTDEKLAKASDAFYAVQRELSTLLNRDRMEEGMKRFWEAHAPQLLSLMTSLNLDVPQVMGRLRHLMQEDVYLWREEKVKEKIPEVIRELDLVDALNELCGVTKQNLDNIRQYFRTEWFKGKLPLIYYKEGQPTEVAELIDYLHELIYRQDGPPKDNRAQDIRLMGGHLESLFNGGASLLATLVVKFTGQGISEDEAAELYEELPNLSLATDDEVRRRITYVLSQQAKRKKVAEVKRRWRELTGSESPAHWSEEMRTPIKWVMEGSEHHTFFERYENLGRLSESELDEMIAYLTNHKTNLNVLQDQKYILAKFVQTTAGEYADLVRQAGAAEELREHIYNTMRTKVYQWPMRLSEVVGRVRQWITENYKATAYPQVVKAIEAIPPDDIKRVVKDLAAEDAIVGARLLAAIQGESGKSQARG